MRVSDRLHDSIRVLKEVRSGLEELDSIGRTSDYLAQCINIESAQAGDFTPVFGNLAQSMKNSIGSMESVLEDLARSTANGESRLHRLLEAVGAS